MQIVSVLKGTPFTRAPLRNFGSHTSLGIGWEAIMQTVMPHLTYLSVSPFHNMIVSHMRFIA